MDICIYTWMYLTSLVNTYEYLLLFVHDGNWWQLMAIIIPNFEQRQAKAAGWDNEGSVSSTKSTWKGSRVNQSLGKSAETLQFSMWAQTQIIKIPVLVSDRLVIAGLMQMMPSLSQRYQNNHLALCEPMVQLLPTQRLRAAFPVIANVLIYVPGVEQTSSISHFHWIFSCTKFNVSTSRATALVQKKHAPHLCN